ncbi:MAG: hypothetical protein RMA76_41270 [Deltaproteobacteria bacterium]|jgi:hypothetical protein
MRFAVARLLVFSSVVALVFTPAATRASQDSNSSEDSSDSQSSADSSDSQSSENSSDNSDASSEDSDASSQNSEGSSQDSAESSADSRDSSDDSSNDSSENSSNDSSNGSSNRQSSKALTVLGAIVVLAGVAAGVALTIADATTGEEELASYLERHHPIVVRDVVVARGPILAAWTRELGLSPTEEAAFFDALDGSAEQTAMLNALGGTGRALDPRAFATHFVHALERTIGAARLTGSVERLLGSRG